MGGLSADDFCACGALVDWDAEDARRCRGCGEEIETMSDAVMGSDLFEKVKGDMLAAFPGVAPDMVRQIADEFLAQIVARADTSAERALDSLVVCQDDGCSTITGDAREYDDKRVCPKCCRASVQADREASAIAATHGPEIRGVRVRRGA